MKVKILTNSKEIESLNIVGYNIEKNMYIKKDLRYYEKIMIVGNIVVNIDCNSDSCNEEIIESIKNNNYDFCGLVGMLKE